MIISSTRRTFVLRKLARLKTSLFEVIGGRLEEGWKVFLEDIFWK